MTSVNQRSAASYSEVDLTANAFDHPEWKRAHPIQITRKWSGADALALAMPKREFSGQTNPCWCASFAGRKSHS